MGLIKFSVTETLSLEVVGSVVVNDFLEEIMIFLVVLVDLVLSGLSFEDCIVVGLVELVRGAREVGLGDFVAVDLLGFVREGVPALARRVLSPSIDLFEFIIYNYSMKVQKITKKQQAVLNFLEDFTEENGYSPSYREIMTGLGLSSVSAVAEHIDNMVSKGILKKVPGAARSLEVLDFRHTETVELFKNRLGECTEEERGVLVRAAEILGLDLE